MAGGQCNRGGKAKECVAGMGSFVRRVAACRSVSQCECRGAARMRVWGVVWRVSFVQIQHHDISVQRPNGARLRVRTSNWQLVSSGAVCSGGAGGGGLRRQRTSLAAVVEEMA